MAVAWDRAVGVCSQTHIEFGSRYREAMPVEEVMALTRRLAGIREMVDAVVTSHVPVDTDTG